VTAIGDSSAEAQVKVAPATRDGQQTAEMQTLALHIAARSARGDSRFTIRLDPPELGRIEVNLSVSSHGQAQAVLAVEKPQTLDLLLRDAPMLERALKDAGLELGSNLSFSLKEDGQPQFSRDNPYAPPTRTLELVPVEPTNTNPLLNTSLVEQLYGLRMARLDITV
jgi:flagellar hook-length control protein FliK